MKISELFRRLSYGELSNLSLAGEGSGFINPDNHPQMIQYTNEALLRLYSRFTLLNKDVLLEQVGHITNYHLIPRYAESSRSDARYPYIKDLPGEPFTGDVIRILEVFNQLGRLPLNDMNHALSVFTPTPDTLQVPNPVEGAPLSVMYQARHPVLNDIKEPTEADSVLTDQEITLPFFLEGALTNFIAYKVYSHMNGADNMVKSQEYNATYETICLDVETRDLVNQTIATSHHKLEQRGFV